MRMVARKPVSSSTVTQELMMENQWICARFRSEKQIKLWKGRCG